ncbi:MAG TPA: 2-C-methyl-D-erythritol 2,4-cyclodiphosphate synthase, partial [Dehalococcoidia bacterium]|nr:2-C-methyl-D-erythritol 2,4-cyclodiphosphate synthase [Dehalococcoidia bacterium]
ALTHAVIDALLGAAALGDVGSHFPSSDPNLKGADSLELLKAAKKLVAAAGYVVCNIDATVITERPRIQPYVQDMRQRLARALDVDLDMVSVKATTTDRLGAVGRQEGIAVQAVALIEEV